MTGRVVDAEGDEKIDWRLVVTDGGAVEARKMIPFDGVRRFSTVDRRNRLDKTSEFGLDVATVIDRYHARAGTATPRPQLASDVEQALAALQAESDDEEDTATAPEVDR